MKVRQRIACYITAAVLLGVVAVGVTGYALFAKNERQRFSREYEVRLDLLEEILTQFETHTSHKAFNALDAWKEHERYAGLEDMDVLRERAARAGLTALFAADANGTFVRSTLRDASVFRRNLFDYCSSYRRLITGEATFEQTPFLIGSEDCDSKPLKYALMPNHDRTLIFEASVSGDDWIASLRGFHERDPSILSLEILSPRGERLAELLGNEIQFGKRKEHYKILTLTRHVRPAHLDNCEYTRQSAEPSGREYGYTIVAQISTQSVEKSIDAVAAQLATSVVGIVIVFSVIVFMIAVRLSSKLEKIAKQIALLASSSTRLPATDNRAEDEVEIIERFVTDAK
jgi:hypothetical protein